MALRANKVLISGLVAAAWLFATPASWAQESEPEPDPETFSFTITGGDNPQLAYETSDGIEVVEAVLLELSGAASADALATQQIVGNVLIDHGSTQVSRVEGSFNNSQGIMQLNQNSGSLVNQANVLALAVGDAGLADASAATTVQFTQNELTVMEGAHRQNSLIGSFNNTVGIAMVNQNAGNMNQQANVIAIAVGIGPAENGFVSMGDASLGTVTGDNTFDVDPNATYENELANSFENFHGVATVTQVAGDGNIVANNIAISVNVITGP